MDIFINTDKSPALIQAKATGSPLSGFKVKRGAVVPLSVTVPGTQTATGLRMGFKAKVNYEGDLLILAEAESGTLTEQGTRFDLKLIASSLALNDALDVGEGTEAAWLASLKGERGSRGEQGEPGEAGASAYEQWLTEGNTGEKADFFADLGTSALATMYQSPPGTATDNANIYGFGMVMKCREQVRYLAVRPASQRGATRTH